jgi:hypothetical protein
MGRGREARAEALRRGGAEEDELKVIGGRGRRDFLIF